MENVLLVDQEGDYGITFRWMLRKVTVKMRLERNYLRIISVFFGISSVELPSSVTVRVTVAMLTSHCFN